MYSSKCTQCGKLSSVTQCLDCMSLALNHRGAKLNEILNFLRGERDKTAVKEFIKMHKEDRQFLNDLIKECFKIHSYSFLSDFIKYGNYKLDHHTVSLAYSHEEDEQTLIKVLRTLLKGATQDSTSTECEADTFSNHITSFFGRALLSAAKDDRIEVVRYILEQRCTPQIMQAPVYMTPLDLAAGCGNSTVLDLLLQNGAKVHKENLMVVVMGMNGAEYNSFIKIDPASDRTPLHYAVGAGHKECVLQLLGAGAGVNVFDQFGCTPLSLAVSNQQVEIVTMLVEDKNCDINMSDDHSGMTALHRAADLGDMSMINVLLEANANPNIKDLDEASPLSLAVNSGHFEVCCNLLPLMGQVDPDGELLEMCMMRAYWQIAESLIQYGASSKLLWKKEITESLWPLSRCPERGLGMTDAENNWSTVALSEPLKVHRILQTLTLPKPLKHLVILEVRKCLKFVCQARVDVLSLPFSLQHGILLPVGNELKDNLL